MVERLVGLEADRCREGLSRVASWKIPHVTQEFVSTTSADSVVAATLLSEAVLTLEQHGVPTNKLMSKLRGDGECWPVWAELRAGAMIASQMDVEMRIEMEPGKSQGKQPDFRLVSPDGLDDADIEFKAVGHSDRELEFLTRAAKVLPRMVPPVGMTTGHAWIDGPLQISEQRRKESWKNAGTKPQEIPSHARAFNGAQIVGHNHPAQYLDRLRTAVQKAIEQLPRDKQSWVAFWWSNGAAVRPAAKAVQAMLPAHVAGVIFIGQAVIIPWPNIHCFHLITPREAEREGDMAVVSVSIDDDMATNLLDRVDSSSGLRATLLRAGGRQGSRLVHRNGSRRLAPFNLLFDADPAEYIDPLRTASWAQQTRLH